MRMQTNWNSHTLLVGMQNAIARHFGQQVCSLYKINHKISIQTSNRIPRCPPKRNESIFPHKNLHTVFFPLIIKKCKHPKCPGEQTSKLWYIHTMKCYLTIKMNELLTPTTWMNLTCIMLTERSHTQKSTYMYMSIQKQRNYKDRNQTSGCQELCAEGEGRLQTCLRKLLG